MRKSPGLLLLALALAGCGSGLSSPRLSPAAARQAVPQSASRWVDTHGIEGAGPKSWPDNRGTCGTPQANTVMWNEDSTAACLVGQPRGLSVVEFGGVLNRPSGWYERTPTRVTIDGATARRWDAGEYPVREISQAKLMATQVNVEVADEAIQILGGHGYMSEFPVERAWRDARLSRIGAGTDEIMKEIIAKTYGL